MTQGQDSNKYPSFYENVETEDINVLLAEKDQKSHHPSSEDKTQTKLGSADQLSDLKGQEINRRKCSINEHFMTEEERARLETEFPVSDFTGEKNREVTTTEVTPERVLTVTGGGSPQSSVPTYARKARQMKLDWLNGKSVDGSLFN